MIPFTINWQKHHLDYIRSMLKEEIANEISYEIITLLADRQGDNVIDLYIGNLKPEQILNEIKDQLTEGGSFEKPNFIPYIRKNGGYGVLQISDGSFWVLRQGNDPIYYIHLHPARNAPLSVRVTANALKTAMVIYLEGKQETPDISTINALRIQYLNLSPIKEGGNIDAIRKMLGILNA